MGMDSDWVPFGGRHFGEDFCPPTILAGLPLEIPSLSPASSPLCACPARRRRGNPSRPRPASLGAPLPRRRGRGAARGSRSAGTSAGGLQNPRKTGLDIPLTPESRRLGAVDKGLVAKERRVEAEGPNPNVFRPG